MGIHVTIDMAFLSLNDYGTAQVTVTRVGGESQTFNARHGNYSYYLRDVKEDPNSEYKFDFHFDDERVDTPVIKHADVHIKGKISPRRSQKVTTEAEWSEYVTDTSESFITLDEYEVELVSVDGVVRRFNPTSISYGPRINASQDLGLECEPFEWLEGTDWLGARIRVYAGGDFIYEGEVKEIDTNQPHDEYGITTRSYGKKLLGKTVDLGTRNQIATDAIAELVDKSGTVYTEWADEQDSQNSNNTNISYANGVISVSDPSAGSGADITEDIGPSAHKSQVYVKAYNPDGLTVTVNDFWNAHSETLPLYSDNEFGRWYRINPEGVDDAWFDLELELQGNTVVRDFRVVENPDIVRDIEPPDLSGAESNVEFYSYGSDSVDSGLENVQDTKNVVATSSGYRPRQKSAWHVVASGDDDGQAADTSAVDDIAYMSSDTSNVLLDKFKLDDRFPYWYLRGRVALETDNGAGTAGYDITVNNDTVSYSIDTSNIGTSYEWKTLAAYDDSTNWGTTLTGDDTIEWSGSGTDDVVGFDCFAVIIGSESDIHFTYEYSSSLTNGQLSRPERFGQGYVEFEDTPTPGDMTYAKTVADIEVQTEVHNVWGPTHTNVPGQYDMTAPNADTIETEFDGGSTHTAKVEVSSYGTRDNATPRIGYNAQEVTGITVTGSHNELQRIFNMELKGNILSIMNSIAGDTNITFRFEGDTVKVFEDNQLVTEPDLLADTIESSASIEEVYKSCEVKGDGVTSGIIEAENAPDFIDDHKEINDQEITNKRDAIRRAKGFLRENGSIKYKGSIDTLPSFAPLGEMIPGEYFNHGQKMQIRSISYGREKATIKLGYEKSVADELIAIKRDSDTTTERFTN